MTIFVTKIYRQEEDGLIKKEIFDLYYNKYFWVSQMELVAIIIITIVNLYLFNTSWDIFLMFNEMLGDKYTSVAVFWVLESSFMIVLIEVLLDIVSTQNNNIEEYLINKYEQKGKLVSDIRILIECNISTFAIMGSVIVTGIFLYMGYVYPTFIGILVVSGTFVVGTIILKPIAYKLYVYLTTRKLRKFK